MEEDANLFVFTMQGGPSMSQFDEIQNISFLVPKDSVECICFVEHVSFLVCVV